MIFISWLITYNRLIKKQFKTLTEIKEQRNKSINKEKELLKIAKDFLKSQSIPMCDDGVISNKTSWNDLPPEKAVIITLYCCYIHNFFFTKKENGT